MQEENEEDEEDIDEDGSEDQVMYLYSSIEIHPADTETSYCKI